MRLALNDSGSGVLCRNLTGVRRVRTQFVEIRSCADTILCRQRRRSDVSCVSSATLVADSTLSYRIAAGGDDDRQGNVADHNEVLYVIARFMVYPTMNLGLKQRLPAFVGSE